ncbi:uncharacterized protein LOC100371357 [Saccoglossus kowalevskii]
MNLIGDVRKLKYLNTALRAVHGYSQRQRMGRVHQRIVRGTCSGIQVKCTNSTQCIFRDQLCDDHVDCDNGSDEWSSECTDEDDNTNWDILIGQKSDSEEEEDNESETIECDNGSYPEECNCTHFILRENGFMTSENQFYTIIDTRLDCSHRNLTSIPGGIPPNITKLNLRYNSIQEVKAGDLYGLYDLTELLLSRNIINDIAERALDHLANLMVLDLEANKLKTLPESVFSFLNNLVDLDLSKNDLGTLPIYIFKNLNKLQKMDLSGNEIRLIQSELFLGQGSLDVLHLGWNRPLEISEHAFSALRNLTRMRLLDNGLSHLRSGMFRNLNRLKELDLERNQILSIKKYDLQGLTDLSHLKLKNNTIRRIEDGAFDHTPSISELWLSMNDLTEVKRSVFLPLKNLKTLDLSFNKIEEFEDGALSNSVILAILLLAGNRLPFVRTGMFANLTKVSNLPLFDNEIAWFDADSLQDMESLRTLDLQHNPVQRLPMVLFDDLPSLEWVHFDHFWMCGYAPTVRHCTPRGDGISSVENLLDNVVLRVMVWVVAMLAFVGNLFVLVARCILKEDNRIHSFFIMNLSLADLLMGLYLFIIALHDVMYRGEYIKFDLEWRLGWVCQMCGFLSLVSSEASVLTLAIITMDRFICIVYPFKFKNRNMKIAVFAMLLIWISCVIIATLPLIDAITYFGDFFYGGNGVCLPLHIDDPKADGWEYSLVIFVLVNFMAFLFIVFAYMAMFTSIKKSRSNIRSTKENQDLLLVKRFTLIVATDFICWMPIIIIKFAALAGAQISGGVYAWVAVFILPVNSALNPILYTMTTKMFKQKFMKLLGISNKKKNAGDESYSASKTTGTRLSSVASSRNRISLNGNIKMRIPQKQTNCIRTITKGPNYPVNRSVLPSRSNDYTELNRMMLPPMQRTETKYL